MSMSTWAVTADTVSAELVEQIVPVQYRIFMAFEDKHSDLFYQAQYADFEDDKLENAAEALCDAFKLNTGLDLYMGYLDETTGERSDEFRGNYFGLGGVFVKSAAALQFEEDHSIVLETQYSTDWG